MPIRLTVLIALGALVLGGCGNAPEVRYRMTVAMKHGKPVQTFSRVWSVRIGKASIPLVSPFSERFRGEAIPIRLPGRPTLYALTGGARRGRGGVSDYLSALPEIMFSDALPKGVHAGIDRVEALDAIRGMVGQQRTIACEPPTEVHCPAFVYFDDTSAPRTIHVINSDNCPPEFADVDLTKVYITIVTDRPEFTDLGIKSLDDAAAWSRWISSIAVDDPRQILPRAFRSR